MTSATDDFAQSLVVSARLTLSHQGPPCTGPARIEARGEAWPLGATYEIGVCLTIWNQGSVCELGLRGGQIGALIDQLEAAKASAEERCPP